MITVEVAGDVPRFTHWYRNAETYYWASTAVHHLPQRAYDSCLL